jgi:hypothetical protein
MVLFSTSLAGSALAQLGNAPAALYAGADIVFDGRLEKIASSPSGLTARFLVTRLIKGRAATTKEVKVQIPSESRCHAFEENH